MKLYHLILSGLLGALSAGVTHASVITYKLKYDDDFGPQGKGEFTFQSCPPDIILNDCPSLDFETAFSKDDPDLIFDQLLLGGGAEALLRFFLGDPSSSYFPAINLASWAAPSQPISALLSFESAGEGLGTGVYCIRPSNAASGLCANDPSVIGIGTWSAISVPEPTTLSLLAAGLLAISVRRRRKTLGIDTARP